MKSEKKEETKAEQNGAKKKKEITKKCKKENNSHVVPITKTPPPEVKGLDKGKEKEEPNNDELSADAQQVKEFCEAKGYTCLIPGRGRAEPGTREQMMLYYNHPEAFTQAVKELTALVLQTNFGSVKNSLDVSSKDLPPKDLPINCIGRPSQVNLFLEDEGTGKLEIIPCKDFKQKTQPVTANEGSLKCGDLIHLFPYHVKEIIEVAERCDVKLGSETRSGLERDGKESRQLFEAICVVHPTFLKAKKITIENPTKMLAISSKRQEKLKQDVIEELRDLHGQEDGLYEKCLGKEPKKTIARFEEEFPNILNVIEKYLSEKLEKNLKEQQKPLNSLEQVLSVRTLVLALSDLYNLGTEVAPYLKMLQFDQYYDDIGSADLMIQTIFDGLAENEAAYYNTSFGPKTRYLLLL